MIRNRSAGHDAQNRTFRCLIAVGPILEPGPFSVLERVSLISSFPLPALAGKAQRPHGPPPSGAQLNTSVCAMLIPPWEGPRSFYTVPIAPVHTLSHTYALYLIPHCTPSPRNEKERGSYFKNRSSPKLTCGCGRGPTTRNLVGFVRNTSVLAVELVGRGRKKEKGISILLSLVSSWAHLCYPRGQRAHARYTGTARRHTRPLPPSLPYATIISGGKQLDSLSLDWETTQHPSNALFRYGWEAYDSL
jgi:hypothetical protein